MTKKIRLLLACVLLFFINSLLAENKIKQIRSNSLSDKLQIVIDVENKPDFNVFVLSNPVRLVIDIKGKVANNYRNKLSFKNRGVTKVRTGNRSDDEIRLVLDLNYDYHWEIYDLLPAGRYGHRIVVDVYDYALKKQKSAVLAAKTDGVKMPIVLESLANNNQPNTSVKPSQSPKSNKPVVTLATTATDKPSKPTAALAKADKPPSKSIKATTSKNKTASQSVVTKETLASKVKKVKSRDIIVVIDPGHGGKDSGALGATGAQEKVVVLQIAKRLKKKIDAIPGMRAVLTRQTDKYISLRGRLRLARKFKGDLFVSIHADAFTRRSARGASVYILSNRGASSEAARWLAKRENAVDLKYGVDIGDYERDVSDVLMKMQQDAAIEASHILASKTLSRLKGVGKVHKQNVERAGFAVLKSPDIPSMLVETAFISNPTEEKRLQSPIYQNKLATAIAKGIKQYFDVHLPHHLLLMDAPK